MSYVDVMRTVQEYELNKFKCDLIKIVRMIMMIVVRWWPVSNWPLFVCRMRMIREAHSHQTHADIKHERTPIGRFAGAVVF